MTDFRAFNTPPHSTEVGGAIMRNKCMWVLRSALKLALSAWLRIAAPQGRTVEPFMALCCTFSIKKYLNLQCEGKVCKKYDSIKAEMYKAVVGIACGFYLIDKKFLAVYP